MLVGSSNSSVILTFRALAIFSKVSLVGLPLIALDNPTADNPILSANSFWVIPACLQISNIRNFIIILIVYFLQIYKIIVLVAILWIKIYYVYIELVFINCIMFVCVIIIVMFAP
nr:MAG TPA: hypothetical protein [Bacteriophage sp.]